MLLEYLRYGELHHWAVFCCTVATLGLFGAGFASVGICFGKGALGFLNGAGRQQQVIVVNGSGQYVQQPQKRAWGLGRTYALFAAIFSGGPMLTLLLIAATKAAWFVVHYVGAHWCLYAFTCAIGIVTAGIILVIRKDRQEEAEAAVLPVATPAPAVSLQPMWSLAEWERDYQG